MRSLLALALLGALAGCGASNATLTPSDDARIRATLGKGTPPPELTEAERRAHPNIQ